MKDKLIKLLDRNSRLYPHLIVDLQGTIALCKLPYSEYQDITSKMEYKEHVEYHANNVKLIAISKEHYDSTDKNMTDTLVLTDAWVGLFTSLGLAFNTEFTTDSLLSLLMSFDYILKNIEDLK